MPSHYSERAGASVSPTTTNALERAELQNALMSSGWGGVVVAEEARFTNPPFKGLGGTTAPIPSDSLIQRGYMRLLNEVFEFGKNGIRLSEVGQAMDHDLGTKLDFQFNPNELTRSVVARTDTQLWINQSPSQLLQPGIGDMSFSWQMLFNRETEVQKGEVLDNASSPLDFEKSYSRLDRFSLQDQVGSDKAAEELGVLADIAILDRITGQSISQQAIEYAQARYNRLVTSGAITEDDEIDTENSIAALASSNPKLGMSLKDANVRNSAFLIPNPIRVVFSENFMVDGYVNSVTVSFKKFSPQMVPTVALVDISMHAIYQGFSRFNSTFTTILELSQEEKEGKGEGGGGATPGSGIQGAQEAGKTLGSVLGGFDHSIPRDNSGQLDTIPNNPQTQLDFHKYDGSGLTLVNGQYALPVTMQGGISFGLISKLDEPGAAVIKEMFDNDSLIIENLSAKVSIGLRLRARLRPTGGNGAERRVMLDALIAEDDPTEVGGGIPGYTKDSVFFGSWSQAQRRRLLAVGDGMESAPNVGPFQHAQTALFDEWTDQDLSGTSTRSFPITSIQNSEVLPADTYGDLLEMWQVEYGSGEVDMDDHWIALAWRDKDKARKWKTDDTKYYLARGFYSSGNLIAFPSELTITSLSSAPNLVFEVDYQMNLLFRTELYSKDKGNTVLLSDTGWRRIHPRTQNSALFPEGGWKSLWDSKSMDLKGSLVGATGGNLDGRFPWQYDDNGANLHFDGHILAQDGCSKWSHQETSALQRGEYDQKDIRVYISSTSTQGYN